MLISKVMHSLMKYLPLSKGEQSYRRYRCLLSYYQKDDKHVTYNSHKFLYFRHLWMFQSKCLKKTNTGIFPSTFLQPINSSKNSILNCYETQHFHVFMFVFVSEIPFKDFPLYSPILLTYSLVQMLTNIHKGNLHVYFQSTILQNTS